MKIDWWCATSSLIYSQILPVVRGTVWHTLSPMQEKRLHVSAAGSDANDGSSFATPYRTLQRAQQEVLARTSENQSIHVLLAAGRYELSTTLDLQPGPAEDGGRD